MSKAAESLTEVLYQALHSPLGIEVQTADAHATRQRLYTQRAKLQDEDLAKLSFCESPFDPTRLWLVKRP